MKMRAYTQLLAGGAAAVFIMLALALPARGQQPPAAEPPQFRLDKIEIDDDLLSPSYDASDRQAGTRDLHWVQILAEYETLGGEDGWIDNLTFDWYVLLLEGRVPRLVMTESVTYMDVKSEEEHRAVVYIRPRPIMRYYDDRGRISRRDVIIHLDVKVGTFVIGSFDFPEQRPDDIPARWWESPRVNLIEGALLSRNKTPFAPLNYDYYEYIKPETR